MPDGYLPPVIASLAGDAAPFIAKLQEAKALLDQWGHSEATAKLNLDTGAAIAKFRAFSALLSREGISVPLKLHASAVNWAREAAQMSLGQAVAADMIPTRDLREGSGIGTLLANAAGGRGGGGLLRSIFWGRGSRGVFGLGAGLAGMGSLGSLAGLGPEHVLMTLGGLAGSAAGAGIGAGLLGLGSMGVMGVGAVTNAGGIGQAAGDIKGTLQAQNNLAKAIAVYGANSTAAAHAQAALNFQLSGFNQVARQAVLQAANTAQGFKAMYDKVTGAAEKTGAQIINQAMQVGEAFLPTLGKYAAQNMGVIQKSLQPLFSWMQSGSGGLGIFKNLEQIFSDRLPTAMQAFSQGIELLLRTINLIAPQTGGLINTLAKLTTEFNGAGWSKWSAGVNKFIGMFRQWEALIKIVVADVYQLFHADAGTASGIVGSLTQMLTKLHDWESSTKGQSQMHNLFEAHKQEILSLLQLLPPFIKLFGRIELVAGPPLTKVVTFLAKVADWLTKLPGGIGNVLSAGAGFALLAGHIGLLKPVMSGVTSAFKLSTSLIGGPWTLAIMGAVALAVLIITHWKTVKQVFDDVWHFIEHITGEAVSFIVRLIANDFVKPVLDFFGMILKGAAKMFGWVPGVGGKLKDASKAFDTFKDDVNKTLNGIATDAANWGKNIGVDLGSGLVAGIQSQMGAVTAAAKVQADAVVKATRLMYQSSSPSRVFYRIGQDLSAGLALGVTAGTTSHVIPAIRSMTGQVTIPALGRTGNAQADRIEKLLVQILAESKSQTPLAKQTAANTKDTVTVAHGLSSPAGVAAQIRSNNTQIVHSLRAGSVR